MKVLKRSLIGGAFVAGLIVSGAASAAFCSTSDIDLTINGTTYTPTACTEGDTGNGDAAETAFVNAWSVTGPDPFVLLDKSDNGAATGTSLSGISFQVTDDDSNDGTWTVAWTDTNGAAPYNLPIVVDFVTLLKAADGDSALYFFNDVTLTNGPYTGTGNFEIVIPNCNPNDPTKCNFPAISHLSLFGQYVRSPPPPGEEVPEPRTLALLGAGLAGLALLRRRRRD